MTTEMTTVKGLTTQNLVDYFIATGASIVQSECDLVIELGNARLILTYCVLDENSKVDTAFDYTAFAGGTYDRGVHELYLSEIMDDFGEITLDLLNTKAGMQLLLTVKD